MSDAERSMRWSWPIARVAGIRVYVHFTFLFLLLWAGLSQYRHRHYWGDVWLGLLFVLVLFVIIVLHELGHALTARRFGIPTQNITLLPIGGVARLQRMPEKPSEELLVALAGPAVNVCLAILCFALLGGSRQLAELANLTFNPAGGNLLAALMWVNIGLAVFNLVPAFPMDGGRVLRALLAMRTSYVRATRAAVAIGHGIALVFLVLGISSLVASPFGPFSNPFLAFIGLFVWVAASQESAMVQMKSNLGDQRAGQLMITDFHTLHPEDPLSFATSQLMRGWQNQFPVVRDGRPVGLLTRPDLLKGLSVVGPDGKVEEVMTRDFETIDEGADAEQALISLRTGRPLCLLVIGDNGLVGMLTLENFEEFLAIQTSLERRQATPGWGPQVAQRGT
ncbi:MAG TPA: site-2 protease family protein [Clostridia bacterium]|nr:site-2 protease family protein [Clostridia bacterium]